MLKKQQKPPKTNKKKDLSKNVGKWVKVSSCSHNFLVAKLTVTHQNMMSFIKNAKMGTVCLWTYMGYWESSKNQAEMWHVCHIQDSNRRQLLFLSFISTFFLLKR